MTDGNEVVVDLLSLPYEVAVAILVQDMGFRSEVAAEEFLVIARGAVSGDAFIVEEVPGQSA